MQIHGFNKTTLLDYPGHLASTIFLGGCNFRCPYCHNASLVLSPFNQPAISKDEIFKILNKRKRILEGVCITGGEPTLYPELIDFIREIKSMGFKVKLDTNGSNPKLLSTLVSNGDIDYVAMDIKHSREKYNLGTGISSLTVRSIAESIDYLLTAPITYEFRTTIVKELHSPEDLLAMGEWIKGAKAYYLQAYKDSGDVISPVYSSYSKQELMTFRDLLLPYAETVEIRGID
ncbi:anaerobic ribonucleoside-triphosphate reductase activating protein [Anaerocolumna cellulosilytica]|uniref:Anaerobic ribonucleoside-triphosphate reductase activating protein n=1 Tax=Anaerocolumna cellulosilytica TaxID=433286 RepID=A0A6S6RD24_9FIRM|nr:anaerobic ribonucleoside-triphosphate reductase activating protein [Anaerocolumna cellulosilytica]MBB5195855.1 pyruvate formate lyase activating enzyme [Anaerocolumna cellulosilytica]BCJ96865.1 anaerobic ribonucleoside-triphosphate reductase activating protein [Anaerocolumna cellulosilytica]